MRLYISIKTHAGRRVGKSGNLKVNVHHKSNFFMNVHECGTNLLLHFLQVQSSLIIFAQRQRLK